MSENGIERGGDKGRSFSFWRSLFGFGPKQSLRTDLQDVLASEQSSDPAFTPQERSMLTNILGLRERKIADVMVPRVDVVAVEHATPIGELMAIFREAGHSRLPVYRETLDDPVGMVHIRDFFTYVTMGAGKADGTQSNEMSQDPGQIDLASPLFAAGITRPVLFVPPSMPVMDLLVKMQATRVHMALVIDEYGGTDGLLSIEDLIEEVVGDIEDEHDENTSAIVQSGDQWLANARAPLEDVREALGDTFDIETIGELAEDVDTIGGLVTAILGRVPVRGELVKGPNGFEFEILDADPRRVKRLRIRHAPEGARMKRAANTSQKSTTQTPAA